jgi:D-serine deaminase-like pyridoxal phosphate-dependent protein
MSQNVVKCFFRRHGRHSVLRIYGGYWLAEYESPKGLRFNTALGHSANQENITGSPAVGLQVDDQVFLRPEPPASAGYRAAI